MKNEQPTLEQWERGRAIAATIVQLHGEKYLDFFLKMNEEVQRAEAAQTNIDLAMQFADPALLSQTSAGRKAHWPSAAT